MKIQIVVDANIIISALLGGKPRFILFDPRFEFITTRFTIKEVEEYIPLISEKSSVRREEVKEAISLLPLKIIPRSSYWSFLKEAKEIMADIDEDDTEILALYLKERTYLWSEDKDFEKAQKKIKINLLKTEDLV